MPKRFKIGSIDIPPNHINIMRPTMWGNPFVIGVHGSRTEVIKLFEEYFYSNKNLQKECLQKMASVDGIVCQCDLHEQCHGDVYLNYIKINSGFNL